MKNNTLTYEQWDEIITEHHDRLREDYGKEVAAPNPGMGSMTAMPLANRVITQDMIYNYAKAVGDPNPLWHDEDYAKKTQWGGIIAPPMAEVMVSECAATPPYPDVPEFQGLNAGSKRVYYRKIRPGDSFTATDNLVEVADKSRSDKPYRLFLYLTERKFYNQRAEHVSSVFSSIMAKILPPDHEDKKHKEAVPYDIKPYQYPKELLEEIYSSYNDRLSSSFSMMDRPLHPKLSAIRVYQHEYSGSFLPRRMA